MVCSHRMRGMSPLVFTTTATFARSCRDYIPITVALTGSGAGNYTVALTPASLVIAQAPTLTLLTPSTLSPSPGVPVTFRMQAASTTSGVPTGNITLMDGAATLAVVPLSAAGGASFTTSGLATGAHGLSAVYAGDANFLPSVSAPASVTVGAASDFTLSAVGGSSQSVPAGSAATFNFSVAMQGAALSSPSRWRCREFLRGNRIAEPGKFATGELHGEFHADHPDAVRAFGAAFAAWLALLRGARRAAAAGGWLCTQASAALGGRKCLCSRMLLPA